MNEWQNNSYTLERLKNEISNLISVNKSIKKVWTNNILHSISQYKTREMWFKWLPIFVRKKEKFSKILSKSTSLLVQNVIVSYLFMK